MNSKHVSEGARGSGERLAARGGRGKNLRAFRKRERRCVRKLLKLGAADKSEVFISDGNDSIYAPDDLAERHKRRYSIGNAWMSEHALKGTPLIGRVSGYYEPEWDAKLPSEELAQFLFATEADWEAIWHKEEAAALHSRVPAPQNDSSAQGQPDDCEDCGDPATKYSADDVPLCDGDYAELQRQAGGLVSGEKGE